jgi:serine phosphatase RsbU (regulator of sigma subunit)
LIVLVVGLVVTGLLTWVSADLNSRNEKRLLGLRARDVGTVLTGALPSIQTPLASATALADATKGNAAEFKRLVGPYVGHAPGDTFTSVSLWRVSDPAKGPVAVVGSAPALVPTSGRTKQFFAHAAKSSRLSVIGMLQGPHPRLGYAFTGMGTGPFAAYGESALPSNRYSPVQSNSAFNDLNFAIYLGASTDPADLLAASVRRLPLRGRSTIVRVPFGDTSFTVTVVARGPLAGSLPQRLSWAIAIVGTLLTLGAIALTLRLIQRGRDAEDLAAQLDEVAKENRRLFHEQRGIAQTLQHALLPGNLPQLPGLQVSARYEAGEEGVDVGGDWYDLIRLDDRRLLLVVGDVSGRGLPAATAMAALRFAIHAYAMQGDGPPTFLPKLSRLVSVIDDKLLATVLCALIDAPTREVSITSAGHLPPLIISAGGSEFISTEVGLPVGIDRDASYSSTTITAPVGGTLLAFTDGLVERRGESIEVGLERLRSQVNPNHGPLDQLLAHVLRELRRDPSDDTAIAGIRWVN